MIKLERVREKEAVSRGLRGDELRKKELALFKKRRDQGDSLEFTRGYWKPAKKQLQKEASNKCAYCESKVKTTAHGDVDHFRPKSRYWWLAYCYDNFTFTCQICNQVHKGDAFPIDAERMAGPDINHGTRDGELEAMVGAFAPDPLNNREDALPLATFEQRCADEKPRLLNPYLRPRIPVQMGSRFRASGGGGGGRGRSHPRPAASV